MSTDCLVCQSSEQKEVIRVRDHLVSQKIFRINECSKCGFRFIHNPPSEQDAHLFYESEDYIEHSDSSKGLINWTYHKARKWMLRYKLRLIRSLDRGNRILDFGTGTGYFLNYMQSKRYEGLGIEISEQAREFGRETFGLDIRPPDRIYKQGFPSEFDYITFWHVLEHVYHPGAIIEQMHRLLAANGVLIIALPNFRCMDQSYYKEFWAGYDVPRHLWHWDRSTFETFMNNHKFELIKTKMLPLDPFYNCLISESYRKKKWAHILIPFIGTASLLRGWIRNEKASSIVYFFGKK